MICQLVLLALIIKCTDYAITCNQNLLRTSLLSTGRAHYQAPFVTESNLAR